MKYGFPYRGSKSSLAENIIAALPAAKNFYDLFAGGCAITHCALLSNKWETVHSNDIQKTPELFLDAIAGKYKNERRWISREEFHLKKETDQYIRWIWSFGNNGAGYLFGKNIEPLKKEAHEYLMSKGYDGTAKTRLLLLSKFKNDKKTKVRLQQLERLERLQQLEQLERIERINMYSADYRDVKIKKNSVVYCDPPYYHKTKTVEKYYGLTFDSDAFYFWARECDAPVFFSSVDAPKDFKIVMEKKHICKMKNKNSHGKKVIVERLFWNGK